MAHIAFSFTNNDQGTRTEVVADFADAYRVVLVDTDAEMVVATLFFRDKYQAINAAEKISAGAVLPGDSVAI